LALPVHTVNLETDFGEAGGHSLSAARVATALEKVCARAKEEAIHFMYASEAV
jgi:hypothetical protein